MYMEQKKPDSRRVKETKERLQKVFLELLKEKPVEEITIREITERAQINRTSFYRYYLDVYDLYDQMADVFAEKFQQIGSAILPKLLQGQPIILQETVLEFWLQNQEAMNVYLQDSRLLNKVKEKNIAYFKNLLQIDENDRAIDFILEFYVAGQIGLITYWMQHPEQISQETFFSLMQDMISRGPLTVMKENIPQDVFLQT